MENIINNAETILEAGAALAGPFEDHGGIPYVALPKSYEVHDLEKLLPTPTRKRAGVTTTDTESFVFYTKKHGSLDNCTIYADIDSEASKFGMVAVINDHGADIDNPQWRDHTCLFKPALAVEWKRWVAKNKQKFNQIEFAAWLEENLSDVATVDGMPTGADILKMALGFEANSDKRLRSKVNLQDGGVRFEFVDESDVETRTTMQAYERFTLGLPVFDGSSSAYPVEARLKYRESDGKLTFWYELIREDRVFKSAVTDELAQIKSETGFPVIHGKP